MRCFFGYWGLRGGGEGRGRDLVVSIVGTMTWGYYKWIIINDNPLVIAPGHETAIETTRSLPPPLPHPTPSTQKTPHTSCIAALEKLDRNLKMTHI